MVGSVYYWPAKDPSDVLDYGVDWTDRLVAGEVISATTFSIVSGDVIINSQSHTDTMSVVWLSSGSDGSGALVNCHVTTSQGRQFDLDINIRVQHA